jgi:hypothetical protein
MQGRRSNELMPRGVTILANVCERYHISSIGPKFQERTSMTSLAYHALNGAFPFGHLFTCTGEATPTFGQHEPRRE